MNNVSKSIYKKKKKKKTLKCKKYTLIFKADQDSETDYGLKNNTIQNPGPAPKNLKLLKKRLIQCSKS